MRGLPQHLSNRALTAVAIFACVVILFVLFGLIGIDPYLLLLRGYWTLGGIVFLEVFAVVREKQVSFLDLLFVCTFAAATYLIYVGRQIRC